MAFNIQNGFYRDCRKHAVLYSHMQYHNDTIIKDERRLLYKIYISHFIVRVRKGLFEVFVREGAGDQTETAIF